MISTVQYDQNLFNSESGVIFNSLKKLVIYFLLSLNRGYLRQLLYLVAFFGNHRLLAGTWQGPQTR